MEMHIILPNSYTQMQRRTIIDKLRQEAHNKLPVDESFGGVKPHFSLAQVKEYE